MTIKMNGFQQVIAVERFVSMQGNGQDILKNQNLHITKQNTSCVSLTSMLVHSGQNGTIVSAILIKIAPELKMF